MIYDIQKANIWKRISAFLFDIIMMSVLVVGVAFLLSWATGYNKINTRYEATLTAVEEKYGIDLNDGYQYDSLPEEKKAQFDAAYKELNENTQATRDLTLMINLSLVIVTSSMLIGFAVLEFVIPMIFKNGQTLGKKIFGIAVIRTSGVRVNGPVMFVRTILGKYAVETMIPAYIIIMFCFQKADLLMIILFALIPIVNLIILIVSKGKYLLHDLLAKTVPVDLASQMIFDSEEEMIEYKKRIHNEMATNADKEKKLD